MRIYYIWQPKEYQHVDPNDLALELKDDKERIRDLIATHSTLYSIQDIADYFDEDKPAAQQLKESKRPKIPRREIEIAKYEISYEHARMYVDYATNWDAVAAGNERLQSGVNSQLTALERLIYDPGKTWLLSTFSFT